VFESLPLEGLYGLNMTRDTIGKISQALLLKTPDSRDPIEIQRSTEREYLNNLNECISRGNKKYHQDFFIHVETKREKLLPNVLRNYFIDRLTCPSPNYDQAVFKYHYATDELEYLWAIPSRDASHYLKDNVLYIAADERELLEHVMDFADGTLFKLCKKLNGEKIESPELLS
jgi:hypothetical protein